MSRRNSMQGSGSQRSELKCRRRSHFSALAEVVFAASAFQPSTCPSSLRLVLEGKDDEERRRRGELDQG